MFEIRAKEWLGTDSYSLGFYFRNGENAKRKCDELNKLLPVYYVIPLIIQDDIE